jgi:hypothetical protein
VACRDREDRGHDIHQSTPRLLMNPRHIGVHTMLPPPPFDDTELHIDVIHWKLIDALYENTSPD